MPEQQSPKEIMSRQEDVGNILRAGFLPKIDNKDLAQRQTEALEFIATALGELVQRVDRLQKDISMMRARP
jgi:hypothetical protein